MRIFGQVSTSSGNEAAVEATAYTEQTAGAQRALKSGSVNDAAAGTGARKVKIKYYTLGSDGKITGPFYETVTLNGVTAVATVATDIALIESLEVISVGSGGKAAGIISLTAAADGTGTVIATIAAAALRTLFAHHYVPTGRRCRVTDLLVVGGDAAQALFSVRAQAYPSANAAETLILNRVGAALGNNAAPPLPAESTPYVVGPARLRAYVMPGNANAQVSYAEFGAVEL